MKLTLNKLNKNQYFNITKSIDRRHYALNLCLASLCMLILLLLSVFSFGQGFVAFLLENKHQSGWWSTFAFIAFYTCLLFTILAYFFTIIIFSLQRLNDLALSKRWGLLLFIPLLDLLFILFLLLMPNAKTASNHEAFK